MRRCCFRRCPASFTSFLDRVRIWPLAFVCFVPLLWSLRDATPRRRSAGRVDGFVTHLGGYLIMHVLRVFAFAPPPLAFLGYLLVCVAQGFLSA